jgi:tetratricopeptide (TPR) repeat protein
MYWNPAGISQIENFAITGTHGIWLIGTYHEFFGVAKSLSRLGSIGLNATYLGTGNIKSYDDSNVSGEDYTANSLSAGLAYALRVAKNMSIGLNLKSIHENIRGKKAWAFAADIGSLYQFKNKKISIGMSVQNLGSRITFVDESYGLPTILRLGVSYRLSKQIVSLDINFPQDNVVNIRVGTECWFWDMLALRLGYRTIAIKDINAIAGLSAGLGFRIRNFCVDYAFVPYGDLGGTHRISLSYGLGSVSKVSAEVKPQPKQEHELTDEEKAKLAALYNRAQELWKEGKYVLALEKMRFALEIAPSDEKINKVYNRLKWLTEILPVITGTDESWDLVRKGLTDYIAPEQRVRFAINALRYSQQKRYTPDENVAKILKRIEEEYPEIAIGEKVPPGMTVVEWKLQVALDSIYEAQYLKAIDACDIVLYLQPDNVLALKRKGAAYYSLGKKKEAKEIWERVLKLNPDDEEIKKFLKEKF